MKIYSLKIILVILLLIKYSIEDNNCKIKMSQKSITDLTNQKLIYNEGALNNTWDESSPHPYNAAHDSDIDYFYIVEFKFSNAHNHDVIVIILIILK
jgi:hypothetical protein